MEHVQSFQETVLRLQRARQERAQTNTTKAPHFLLPKGQRQVTRTNIEQRDLMRYFNRLVEDEYVNKARVKHAACTDAYTAYAVIAEEFGELAKALLQTEYGAEKEAPDIAKEAIQTAAMCAAFLVEHFPQLLAVKIDEWAGVDRSMDYGDGRSRF